MANDKTPVKQTAVDCLIEQLTKEGIYIPFGFYEQAKQMEKEQIIEFASSYGYAISANGHNQDIIEEFYNQEYGK